MGIETEIVEEFEKEVYENKADLVETMIRLAVDFCCIRDCPTKVISALQDQIDILSRELEDE